MESFSNILFSSVIGGPSFVHSPHVPSQAKLNSCSYYLSILDPNMELPELSTKDIDDLLCDSSFSKSAKDITNGTFDNSCNKVTRPASLIISSKQECDPNSACENASSSLNDIVNTQYPRLCDGILFKCVVRSCNSNFSSKSEQMNHFFTEHKDKVITCVSCKSIFKSKYSLHNHFLSHPDCKLKNTYRCSMSQCDKYFFNPHNLEIHLSKQHRVPSISCLSSVCDHKFFDNLSRDEHVKEHHCEMTLHCVQCDKVFLDSDLFDKHESKLHRNDGVRLTCPSYLYPCQVDGCDKGFSSLSNSRRHQQQCHNNTGQHHTDKLLLHDDSSLSNLHRTDVLENSEVKLMFACPLPECSEALTDKASFQSHFLKHFTGELPGDINSLLPPDPPVPGLELHSKTFEANVDYMYQREETNLVQALDLVPDKWLQSLEWLDDDHNNNSQNSCLTSALILPSTTANISRSMSSRSNHRRKHPYQNESYSTVNTHRHSASGNKSDQFDEDICNGPRSKYACPDTVNSSLSYSLLSSTGSCARTCPKVNSVMANLIKRRRVFLKERVGMMQSCDSVLCQPAARQPALKQVVHQIFNSQQLPNKYEVIVNVDCSEEL